MSARIAVIGGGIMGRGIAQALAGEGAVVSVVESSERVADELRALDIPGITVDDLEGALARCELVIEAAPENLELKLDIWRRIDELAPTDAILATNTSSLPVTEIKRGIRWATRARPVSRSPTTTLSTPGGRMSPRMVAARMVDTGVVSDGLRTTVLPAASAGPNFHNPMLSG